MSKKTKWEWIAQSSNGFICKYDHYPSMTDDGVFYSRGGECLVVQAVINWNLPHKWILINLDEYDYEISNLILIKVDKEDRQQDITETIAEKAKKIVYGDREKTYGDPGRNLRMIAGMWSAYLGIEITPEQVCDMMVQLKIARLKSSPDHEDSKVDIIGYTLLKERLKENENKL